MDSNKTRVKRNKEIERNRNAFREIFGDPLLEDSEGIYNTLHNRSSIESIEDKFGEIQGTTNPAKPTVLDFLCDVESAVQSVVLEVLWGKFTETYLHGNIVLTKSERNKVEQSVGKVLRARGISPIKRYFTITITKRK